jgi:hypothetical protein
MRHPISSAFLSLFFIINLYVTLFLFKLVSIQKKKDKIETNTEIDEKILKIFKLYSNFFNFQIYKYTLF